MRTAEFGGQVANQDRQLGRAGLSALSIIAALTAVVVGALVPWSSGSRDVSGGQADLIAALRRQNLQLQADFWRERETGRQAGTSLEADEAAHRRAAVAVESLRKQLAGLQSEASAVADRVITDRGELASIDQTIAAHSAAATRIGTQLADSRREEQRSHAALEFMRLAVAQSLAQLAQRGRELEAARVAYAEVQNGLAAAAGDLDARRRDLTVARESLEARRKAVADATAERDRVAGQAEAARVAYADIQNALAAAGDPDARRRDLAAAADGSRSQRGKAVADATAERDRVAGQAEAARVAYADIQKGLAAATGELDARRRDLAAVQASLDERRKALADAAAERDRVNDQAKAARIALAEVQKGLAAATGDLDARSRDLAAVQASLDERRKAVADATAERDRVNGQARAARVAYGDVQKGLAAATDELARRREDLASAEQRLAALGTQLADATRTAEALRDDRRSLAALTDQLQDLRKSIADATARKESIERQSEVARAGETDVENKAESAARDLAQRRGELAALTGQIEALRASVASGVAERDGIDRLASAARTGYAALLKNLQSKADELARRREDLASLDTQLRAARASLARTSRAIKQAASERGKLLVRQSRQRLSSAGVGAGRVAGRGVPAVSSSAPDAPDRFTGDAEGAPPVTDMIASRALRSEGLTAGGPLLRQRCTRILASPDEYDDDLQRVCATALGP